MLFNNAKKALSEAQERLNSRCEQIKSQVSEVKLVGCGDSSERYLYSDKADDVWKEPGTLF